MTSYRKITSNIAGKLSLLETYLFYCLALCSDCYTMESYICLLYTSDAADE